MGHLPVSVSVIPSPCFINLPFMAPQNGAVEAWTVVEEEGGRDPSAGRLRSTEAGAARLLDVLPAHLIPGGGPLSSMTMWWVLNLRKAEWVVVDGGGGWWGAK